MKWAYGIKNKLFASVVLLTLCLLVLLSNYLDRKHTQNVKHSISTLYEDRLIAENYISKMTSNVYQIREILNADFPVASKAKTVKKRVADFNNIYTIYGRTRLTKTEKVTAFELANCFKKLEQAVLKNNFKPSDYSEKTLLLLRKLSNIQLHESKLIMKEVESQYATIKASSQFAFAIIIVILIVLQIMVFSGESLIPLIKSNDPRLN